MPKQELNLVQFSACGMAQLGTGATEIVRSKTIKTKLRGIQLDYVPDNALRYTVTPAFACSADTTEDFPRPKFSRMDPLIQNRLDPVRHEHRANVPAFSDEINYGPMFFPLLKMLEI